MTGEQQEAVCGHTEFNARVDVTRLTSGDGAVSGYTADVVVRCAKCNEPFDFVGLPRGSAPTRPMVSFDGIEARLPLRPHFDGIPAPVVPSDERCETCGHAEARHEAPPKSKYPWCRECWDGANNGNATIYELRAASRHEYAPAPVVPSDVPEMRRVVFYSGGKASFLAAHRVIERYGVDGVTLLFTDTLIEDADLYRFLAETSAALGVDVTRLADGRTPWKVFTDKRFLGNNRVPLCSRVLKQEVAQRWVDENCDPANTVLYFGIDWTEEHRMSSIRRVWGRWTCESPLLWKPLVEKDAAGDLLDRLGIEQPRLYALGASHNNCGGLCVRAGQGAFAWALKALPDVYAEWERNEERLRDTLGDVSILRDRRGGETRTLPLSKLRARLQETPEQVDMFDIGGCGCFVEDAEDANA